MYVNVKVHVQVHVQVQVQVQEQVQVHLGQEGRGWSQGRGEGAMFR